MDIRLLGPLEAWHDGHSLDLGSPKERALLAILAIDRGEAVSVDRIVDGLWEGEPPASSGKSIQVYVSKLRKVLGAERLLTRGDAYLLGVRSDETDVGRFQRLVHAGEQRSLTGDAGRASVELQEALALWRGPALQDFAFAEFAQAEIARLEEVRLHAAELRYELEVGLGRSSVVLPDIEAMVAVHPYREGLRGLLMVALYQVGRQADALACYHEGRRILQRELGLDPGPRLVALERAVLTQDASVLGRVGTRAAVPAEFSQQRKLVSALHVAIEPDQADPELGTNAMLRAEAIVADAIVGAGGSVEHLAGAGMLGLFGVELARDDHAIRALDAATTAIARLAAGLDTGVVARAGVETGEVLVDTSIARPSVVGAAPAIAARLAHEAGAGQIVAGSRAVTAASSAFEFGPMRLVPFGTGSVGLRTVGVPRPRGAAPGRRGRLVGRDVELDDIVDACGRALGGRSARLVTIIGDAGIGKSRLLEAVERMLDASPRSATWLRGRCIAYGNALTYRAASDILRQLFDLPESGDEPAVIRALAPRPILGLTMGLDVARGLHPLVARDRLYAAWVEVLQERARAGPVVLAIEDLHWAEDPLLELIDRIIEGVSGPLVVIATARPEFLDRWNAWAAGRPSHSAHWLEPLDAAAARAIATERLGGEPPPEVETFVIDRAAGNPFFVEQLIAGLLDRGALESTPSGWQVVPGKLNPAPPDSIQGTVAARIDLLPAQTKAALQAASVVGRRFSSGALLALLDGAAGAFDLLQRRDFIELDRASPELGDRYEFRHAITRDVAYGGLPRGQRARLHASVAAWLLAEGNGRDEDAAMLAHHLSTAAAPDEVQLAWPDDAEEASRITALALIWLERAADLAVGRYEVAAGASLFERALALAPNAETELRLWRKLADANVMRYDGPGFWTSTERALALAPTNAERAELYASLAEVTAIRRGMWREIPPVERLEAWIEHALALAPEAGLVRARALVARAWISPPGAARSADIATAVELTSKADEAPLAAHVAALEARDAVIHQRFTSAVAAARRLLGLVDVLDSPDERAMAHQISIPILAASGELVEAEALAGAFEGITSPLSAHHQLHAVASRLDLLVLRGDPAGILGLLALVRQRVAANRDTSCFNGPRALLICAAAAAETGNAALATQLEDDADAFGMVGYDPEFSLPRVHLALARNDLELAALGLQGSLGDRLNPWLLPAVVPEFLDALVALGERDRVEVEAAPYLSARSAFEPFALRALGLMRRDGPMVARSIARFQDLDLGWRAEQTRQLVGLHGIAGA